MYGKGAVVLRLGGQRPLATIVLQHGDLREAFRHLVQRELRCPSLLALLGGLLDEFDLLTILGLLDHAHRAVDILQDAFAYIRIVLDLGNDGRQLLHGGRAQLCGQSQLQHLMGGSEFHHQHLMLLMFLAGLLHAFQLHTLTSETLGSAGDMDNLT